MSIEFPCKSCGQLLSLADEDAGRHARCPHCSSIVLVPGQQVAREPLDAGSGSAAAELPVGAGAGSTGTAGWFVETQGPTVAGKAAKAVPIQLAASRLKMDPLLNISWQLFRQHLGAGILFALVWYGINVASWFVSWPLAGIQQVAFAQRQYVLWGGLQIAGLLWSVLITSLTSCLLIGFGMAVIRKQPQPVSAAFSACRYYVPVLAVDLLYFLIFLGLAGAFGLPVLAVAGLGGVELAVAVAFPLLLVGLVVYLVVMLSLMLAPYFVIDRNEGVMPALSSSYRFMRGNRLTAFLAYLVVGLVWGVFVLITCGLGALFYIPYWGVFTAMMYVLCTGQYPASADR